MHRAFDVLFPFTLRLDDGEAGWLRLSIRLGGPASLIGLLCSLAAYLVWLGLWKKGRPRPARVGMVAVTGIYGLIAAALLGSDD
jgi:hypothetical protein